MTTTLVIDNYDSFTFNLVHLLEQVNGKPPLVVKNDEYSWSELQQFEFDNVVLSPGPGRPERLEDFGVCYDVLQYCDKPILGVCLGFQGAGLWAGASVVSATVPVHGKACRIHHTGEGLFAGLPESFQVGRYHSLMLQRPLPQELQETAWTDDGVLMAFSHRSRPLWGVQFHPESILTEWGVQLLQNFQRLTYEADKTLISDQTQSLQVFWREGPVGLDAAKVFQQLFSQANTAFWLDGQCPHGSDDAWSYMGVGQELVKPDVLAHLQQQIQTKQIISAHPQLPCPFQGGWVGWLGYEWRPQGLPVSSYQADTPDVWFVSVDRMLALDHRSGKSYWVVVDEPMQHARAYAWMIDMQRQLQMVLDEGWQDEKETSELGQLDSLVDIKIRPSQPLIFKAHQPQATYEANVKRCQDWIRQGESYQLCLTNEISCELDENLDPLKLYLQLRQRNPAPYAAFLRWPQGEVLSASPECFLKVSASGQVQTRPIKGTMARLPDAQADALQIQALQNSAKDAAENIMIVDLLRNDLSQVCIAGSVTVPHLLEVESFKTVHQLVSTVQGQLKPQYTVIDAIKATFPGGSMTGAPKARSLQLLDTLEQRARGIYSGSLGWIGLNGASELFIVIRTIVAHQGQLRFGVGGGVVADSTPTGEFEEMQLKAKASMAAIEAAYQEKKCT